MTRDQVIRILNAHRGELTERFGVKSLGLFGSVVREEADDASDVDLLVEFDRRIGLLHLVGVAQHIERLLGVAKVDLVLRDAVLDELKETIYAEAVNVFGSPEMEVPRPTRP